MYKVNRIRVKISLHMRTGKMDGRIRGAGIQASEGNRGNHEDAYESEASGDRGATGGVRARDRILRAVGDFVTFIYRFEDT
jgi:hypothetical protein